MPRKYDFIDADTGACYREHPVTRRGHLAVAVVGITALVAVLGALFTGYLN